MVFINPGPFITYLIFYCFIILNFYIIIFIWIISFDSY